MFGTHAASAGYGYPYAAAPDCDEGSLGAGCVGDSRGFIQGQCTSWVAFRLAARNGLSFSNWYADRHWGNAADWGKVAKGIGHKPDRTPAIGAIGWYKRGHVSYVEDVYSNGTILISEMNTDGHNGFHFATVSPGMSSYPDKFIHLDDVVPVDTAAPSVPAGVRVVAHRGRNGVTWRPSSDAFGVAGYRVLRNGVPLGTTRRTSCVRTPPPQQVRPPSTPSSRTTPRPRVATGPGPRDARRGGGRPRLGRDRHRPGVLRSRRHRPAPAARLPGDDRGPLAHHRAGPQHHVGRADQSRLPGGQRRRAPTAGPSGPARARWPAPPSTRRTSGWGDDARVPAHAATAPADATWMSTPAGPARCGLSGARSQGDLLGALRPRLGHGHHAVARGPRCGRRPARSSLPPTARSPSAAGCPTTRVPVRRAPTSARLRPRGAPTTSPRRLRAGAPAFPTWVCHGGGARRVLGALGTASRCLPGAGPDRLAHGRRCRGRQAGGTAGLPVVPDRPVRTRRVVSARRAGPLPALCSGRQRVAAGRRAARPGWLRSLQAENRTWVSARRPGPPCAGAPARVRQQRLGCQVLTSDGLADHHLARRRRGGTPGTARSCRPDPAWPTAARSRSRKRSTALSCTLDERRRAGARPAHARSRVPLVLPDLRSDGRSGPLRATTVACARASAAGRRVGRRPPGVRRPPGAPAAARATPATSASTSRGIVISGGTVDGGVARLDHPGVELLELATYLRLGGVPVEPGVELGVVLAELEARAAGRR